MNRLKNAIYQTVHCNGLLADLAYALARPWQRGWFWFRGARAQVNKVQPGQLWNYRQITGASHLTLGVTNVCNAKCVFCAYPRAVESKNLQAGVMRFDIFKKAVDEWASLGGDSIDLTHTVGDPLVDPGLLEKIDYAKNQAGMKHVMLTTNGILLNKDGTYRRLIDFGVSVFISTQGSDREAYEKVYGVNQYKEVISGVENLLAYNRDQGEPSQIIIRFRNSQKPSEIIHSQDFVQRIKPYLSARVRHNFTVHFDNWGGLIQESDMQGAMHLRKPVPRVNVPCSALFGFLVRYDGSVRLCGCRFNKSDMDEMIVGNIRRQTLMEISSSDKAWKIIEGFYSNKRPESCLGCTLYIPVTQSYFKTRIRNSEAQLARKNFKDTVPEPQTASVCA